MLRVGLLINVHAVRLKAASSDWFRSGVLWFLCVLSAYEVNPLERTYRTERMCRIWPAAHKRQGGCRREGDDSILSVHGFDSSLWSDGAPDVLGREMFGGLSESARAAGGRPNNRESVGKNARHRHRIRGDRVRQYFRREYSPVRPSLPTGIRSA